MAENLVQSGSTNPYSPKDWEADWTWYSRQSTEHLKPGLKQDARFLRMEILTYFEKKYGEREKFYRERLEAALKYVEKYAAEIDEGTIAIASKNIDVIGIPAMTVLWQTYAARPDEALEYEMPVKKFLELAREVQKKLEE